MSRDIKDFSVISITLWSLTQMWLKKHEVNSTYVTKFICCFLFQFILGFSSQGWVDTVKVSLGRVALLGTQDSVVF